jgi:acyl-CoA synthetase (AMP-forming)/AMP-acid ligase II/thioesterase domain-containing protein
MEHRPVAAVDSSTGNTPNLTVHEFVLDWARRTPDANAVLAPGRPPLTYGLLNSHIENTVRTLNRMGIGRNDRVAVVLPDGPEMAVAFLSVASGATCAPINPRYQAEEFDFFLSDLKAKALIVQTGMDSPALGVAERKGIDLIRLSPLSAAGAFTLVREKNTFSARAAPGSAQPSEVALVLHTSGTTARPKIVPLTHSNICISANNIRKTLKLENSDCCLNIMPLFHIHGLIGALLSSISAGASIVCTPGFYAPRFFEWMRDFRATWFTAVPTMHQAILARAEEEKEILKEGRLRFIRSCSSALPPQVMTDLEKTFNVPVIEAYGMTEAAHQIASNPLPPRKRKAGSVGMASGPEVAVMDDKGNLVARGETGEIVIRGPNVTKGYENNPEANRKAFTNGWFRTGDQGYFDSDNYLTITDRIKEIINRAGEKISPREIDEVLLSHPSISQAVTFAVKHPRLGEDVAAAVVLRDNATATEREIQEFAALRLADFKVPRQVMIVNQIPKGSTGKIQRVGLAEKLGLTISVSEQFDLKTEYKAPSTSLEKKLTKIWSNVLEIDRIGVNDNFFQLGGQSIQARLIISRICETLQIERIPLAIFLYAPTIKKMACILSQKELSLPPSSLVAIQSSGSKPPIYCVHACSGEVWFLTDLARRLGPEQPFYALRTQGLDWKTPPFNRVEDMARHYLTQIQAIQPEGPYLLGGAGIGGIVALEMAQQLMSQSKNVRLLFLIDTVVPKPFQPSMNTIGFQESRIHSLRRITFRVKNRELLKYARAFLKYRPREVWMQAYKVVDRYVPKTYTGRIVLFMAERRPKSSSDPNTRIDPWREFSAGPFYAHIVRGEHLGILKEPNVQPLAQQLRKYLDQASAEDKP